MAGAERAGKGENIIRERGVGGAERGGKAVITVQCSKAYCRLERHKAWIRPQFWIVKKLLLNVRRTGLQGSLILVTVVISFICLYGISLIFSMFLRS